MGTVTLDVDTALPTLQIRETWYHTYLGSATAIANQTCTETFTIFQSALIGGKFYYADPYTLFPDTTAITAVYNYPAATLTAFITVTPMVQIVGLLLENY